MNGDRSEGTFPPKPTCHEGAWPPPISPLAWREPGNGLPFRTCNYCGSIHPADLVAALERGEAKLGGSDWKYGWPHKFYVDGMAAHAKWYNSHLTDQGFGDAERAKLIDLLDKHAGIRFDFAGDPAAGRLMYSAPYAGYQR